MTRITQEHLDELRRLEVADPRAALHLLQEYQRNFHDDPVLAFASGGVLVDLGIALAEEQLIRNGIGQMEDLIHRVSEDVKPALYYNLANGYYALFLHNRSQRDFRFEPGATPLTQSKGYFRKCLDASDTLDSVLAPQIHINYGNCLAELGRSVEAIEEYQRALLFDPGHPMAWGNLGMELHKFAHVAQRPQLLLSAKEALRRSLSDPALEQLSYGARARFAQALQHVEDGLARIAPYPTGEHRQPEPATRWHAAYMHFCSKNLLFLNFSLPGYPSDHWTEDTLGVRLAVPVDDDRRFIRASRIINEVKESYATARLLLFEASDPSGGTDPVDQLTQYVDNLDYAAYGVAVGKTKLAFQAAANILDRVALLISSYLNLGLQDRAVKFETFLNVPGKPKEPKVPKVREEIVQLQNRYLFALYDMAQDVGSGDLTRYKEIRNYLTHRYLVPHVMQLPGAWETSADSSEYHIEYRELFQKALALMRTARSAVIYLIAFIGERESALARERGPIPPIPRPLYEPFPLYQELDQDW